MYFNVPFRGGRQTPDVLRKHRMTQCYAVPLDGLLLLVG